jgi:hypothetical protein
MRSVSPSKTLVCAHLTKTVARDHGIKRDGDAIVITGLSKKDSAKAQSGRDRPICPVALPDPRWVASP